MRLTYDKGFYKLLLSIALPITIQNLMSNLLNLIDVFMISSLDTSSIAGVGMANKLFFLFNLFLFGTNSGAAILASQYWGSKDKKNIRKVLGISLVLGLSGAFLFTIVAIFAPELFIRILSPETEVIKEGSRYLRTIGISYIITAITFSYSFVLRATHNARLPMTITIISIFVNTFFNWLFIFGYLGAPELGVVGAAIGTVIARVFECLVLLFFVYRWKLPAAGKILEMFRFSKAFFLHYMKTVLFVILNEVVWSLGVVGYSFVYGRMGEVATASIVISQTIEQLAMVAIFGLCNACGVILGNLLGRNEKGKAEEYAKRFMKIIFFLSLIVSLLICLLAPTIATIFNVEPQVKRNIILCLIAFGIYLPFKAFNALIIVGVLRSGGDTVSSLLIDLTGVWFVGLPLGILGGLFLKLDIQYVYAMIMFEEAVKLILCMARYRSKKWIKNIVVDTPA